MNQGIPDWFLRFKEKVWETLTPLMVLPNPHKANRVEKAVNKLIREAPFPITTNHGRDTVDRVIVKPVGQDLEVSLVR